MRPAKLRAVKALIHNLSFQAFLCYTYLNHVQGLTWGKDVNESVFVKQISVFMENTPGRLAHFTRLMGNHNIDIVSLTVADGTHLSILRCIVAEYEKAMQVLAENGYSAKLTEVLAVSVSDRPGGLADVAELLCQNGVNVEYLYSFVRKDGEQAPFIFRVDKAEAALGVLEREGVKLLSQEELFTL